jgi:hypothetical protein
MIARSFALAAAVAMTAASTAVAMDQSARDAGAGSPVELCCTRTALPPIETSVAPERHVLLDHQTAPVTQAKPGLDGANWNCRRPDGSLRCLSSLQGQ